MNFGSPGCIFLSPVHLLYLDDSGSASNVNEQYLVLGGVSVFEAQSHWVTRKLDRLAEGIVPEDPSGVEFHASEIYARRKRRLGILSDPHLIPLVLLDPSRIRRIVRQQ